MTSGESRWTSRTGYGSCWPWEGRSEALAQVHGLVDGVLALDDPELTINLAEAYAAILAQTTAAEPAARLLGSAEARREAVGIPRNTQQDSDLQRYLSNARQALPADAWQRHYQRGHAQPVEAALRDVQAWQSTNDPADPLTDWAEWSSTIQTAFALVSGSHVSGQRHNLPREQVSTNPGTFRVGRKDQVSDLVFACPRGDLNRLNARVIGGFQTWRARIEVPIAFVGVHSFPRCALLERTISFPPWGPDGCP